MRHFLKIVTVVILVVLPLAMTACNTVAGAGKDTQAAGAAVENSADKNK